MASQKVATMDARKAVQKEFRWAALWAGKQVSR